MLAPFHSSEDIGIRFVFATNVSIDCVHVLCSDRKPMIAHKAIYGITV